MNARCLRHHGQRNRLAKVAMVVAAAAADPSTEELHWRDKGGASSVKTSFWNCGEWVNKWCRVPQYGPSSLGRRGRTKHPNKTFRDGVLTLCWRTLNNNDFRRYGSYVWSSLLLLFCTFVLFVSLVRGWTTSILPQGKGHLVHSCCLARVLLLSSPASGNTQVGGAPPQTFVCVYGLQVNRRC